MTANFSIQKDIWGLGLPWWLRWQRIHLQCRRPRFDPWVRKILWRREWLLTPVFLPGEFYAQKSLAGYNLWVHTESDMTEQLTLFMALTLSHRTVDCSQPSTHRSRWLLLSSAQDCQAGTQAQWCPVFQLSKGQWNPVGFFIYFKWNYLVSTSW